MNLRLINLMAFALLSLCVKGQVWTNPTIILVESHPGTTVALFKNNKGFTQKEMEWNDGEYRDYPVSLNLDGKDSFYILELNQENDTMRVFIKLLDYNHVPILKNGDPEYTNLSFEELAFNSGCYYLNLTPYTTSTLYDLSDKRIEKNDDSETLSIKISDILRNPISCNVDNEFFSFAKSKDVMPNSITLKCSPDIMDWHNSESCFDELSKKYSFSARNFSAQDDTTENSFYTVPTSMNRDNPESLNLFLTNNITIRGQTLQIKQYGLSGHRMVLTFDDSELFNAKHVKIQDFRFVNGFFVCSKKCYSEGAKLSDNTLTIDFNKLEIID